MNISFFKFLNDQKVSIKISIYFRILEEKQAIFLLKNASFSKFYFDQILNIQQAGKNLLNNI